MLVDFRNRHADEEREDNDWQDVRFCHGGNRIGRNHVDEDLHDSRRLFDFRGRLAHCLEAMAGLNQAGDGKADDDGDGRRNQIEKDGAGADAAQLTAVPAKARNPYDEGAEDHGNNHHFNQVDEDGADGCDPFRDERQIVRAGNEAADDRQDQSGKDLN